jgi:hypothetical protein
MIKLVVECFNNKMNAKLYPLWKTLHDFKENELKEQSLLRNRLVYQLWNQLRNQMENKIHEVFES